MSVSRRSVISVSVLVVLAAVVGLAYWHQSQQKKPGQADDSTAINVTSGEDRGAGTLREALFVVASDARTPLLVRVWSDEARGRFALVKQCFDPLGVFNPGVKVPMRGERALGEIKYDPSLSPLPAAASAALAHVDRERAYAESRLELLHDDR